MENKNEIIIKSVFKNVYLLRLIYSFVKIYNDNEFKEFLDRNQLLLDNQREYISNIRYNGSGILKKGDLPITNDCVLKEVTFTNSELILNHESIPYGVEIINLHESIILQVNQLSILPKSINTIYNVEIKSNSNGGGVCTIPPNITSISFRITCEISYGLNKYVIIPNTIKYLKLYCPYSNSLEMKFIEGDLPMMMNSSLTSLHIPTYKSKLSITYDSGIFTNFLPSNIESLYLALNQCTRIAIESNLNLFKTIKNLEIYGQPQQGVSILPDSLPPNLEDLKILNCLSLDKKKIFPKNLKQLEISFIRQPLDDNNNTILGKGVIPDKVENLKINKLITHTGILPCSLINLELNFYSNHITQIEFNKMISILPLKQLKSITIPNRYKDLLNIDKKSSSSTFLNKINFI